MVNIARRHFKGAHGATSLGHMDVERPICKARMWFTERTKGGRASPRFSMCCCVGDIVLPPLTPTPPILAEFLRSNTAAAKEFRENIRSYNGTLSFTSLGANIDRSVANNRVAHTVSGFTAALTTTLAASCPGTRAMLLFFIRFTFTTREMSLPTGWLILNLTQATLAMLQEMMHNVSPFVTFFKNTAEVVRESGGAADVRLLLRAEGSPDPRRYNPPTADEIGLLMSDTMTASNRDIVIRTRTDELEHISELHQHYDALHYVLIFPHGDAGWTIDARSNGRRITTMNWYSYRLMVRDNGHDLHVWAPIPTVHCTCTKWSKIDFNIYASTKTTCFGAIPWRCGRGRTGRQRLAVGWAASHTSIVIYWEPTPHAPAVPGCNEYCPTIPQARLFHHFHLQPKLAESKMN